MSVLIHIILSFPNTYFIIILFLGMPHIHLVGWLHDYVIKPHLKNGSFEYKIDDKDVNKVQTLIDKHITCQLPENEEMCKNYATMEPSSKKIS